MLVQKDRLELDRPVLVWIRQALGLGRVELAEVSPEIACLAAALPGAFPGDPADRLIAATAIAHRAVLLTKDSRIRRSRVTTTLW